MNTALLKETAPILLLKNVSRRYPGILALDGVSFDVRPGEVHALVGENGAGKSTLINILAGVIRPSNGSLDLNGRELTLPNPLSSQQAGIGVIFQEFNLLPHLSVAENIFLNREPGRGGIIDWNELYKQAAAVIALLNVEINPRVEVRTLSVAQQQLVEIARVLSMQPRVVVMDEPTAALNEREVERLLEIVRSLVANGVAVVYVSHRLAEVFAIADRITVLRDGRHILTADCSDLTEQQVVAAMVGRELLHEEIPLRQPAHLVLKVQGLTVAKAVSNVSFELRAGEVLGLAGLMGSGSTQVVEALAGLRPITAGTVELSGKRLHLGNPRAAMQAGIAFVPEDRKRMGILPDLAVIHNFSISVLNRFRQWGLLNRKRESGLMESYREKLQIHFNHPAQAISGLSGGNQQKVILARSLALNCKVLLLSEPTRGVDVGAKAEIYALIDALVKEGMAVLLQSSELPEILRLANRCIVFAAGQPQGELAGANLSQPAIMHLATGLTVDNTQN